MRCLPLACLALLSFACESPTPIAASPPPTASQIALTASPSAVLLSGSQVRISARPSAAGGRLVPGATLTFSTSAGSIEPQTVTLGSGGMGEAVLVSDRPATVTASVDGVSSSVEVGAVAPYTLTLANAPDHVGLTGFGPTITIDPNRSVVSPPLPMRVSITCGGTTLSREGLFGVWSPQCAFASPGTHALRAAADAANGWSAVATGSVTVTPTPEAPRPAPPAPVADSVTLEVTELHTTGTSATWRFIVMPPVGKKITGEVRWFFDYVDDPSAGATPLTRTMPSEDDQEDVTYRTPGTKQIRVRTTVSGTEVSAAQNIAVTFR